MSNSYRVSDGAYESNSTNLTLGPYERIIEDFEYSANDLDNFYAEEFRFDTDQNRVSHGSQSVRHTRSAHNQMYSFPGDGKDYYPQLGDTIAVDMTSDGGYFSYFAFFKESGTEEYELRISDDENSIQFVDGEINNELIRIDENINTHRFYTLQVDTEVRSNGDHVFHVSYQRPNGSWVGPATYVDSDSLYSGRGFGFGGTGNGRFDYLRVL